MDSQPPSPDSEGDPGRDPSGEMEPPGEAEPAGLPAPPGSQPAIEPPTSEPGVSPGEAGDEPFAGAVGFPELRRRGAERVKALPADGSTEEGLPTGFPEPPGPGRPPGDRGRPEEADPPEEEAPRGFQELRREGEERVVRDAPLPVFSTWRPAAPEDVPEELRRARERRRLEEQLDAEELRVNQPLTRAGSWLAVAFVAALFLDMGLSILLLTSAGWVVALQRLAYAVEWVAGSALVLVVVAGLVLGYRMNRRRREVLGEE